MNGKINIVTMADAQDILLGGDAPLIIPSGFQAVTMAPSADSLDPLPFGQ